MVGRDTLSDVPLSDRDKAILDFERTWWTEPGSKAQAIRDRLALSGTRYYELVAELMESPAAMAYDPLVVRRLRRRRAEPRRVRVDGRREAGR